MIKFFLVKKTVSARVRELGAQAHNAKNPASLNKSGSGYHAALAVFSVKNYIKLPSM